MPEMRRRTARSIVYGCTIAVALVVAMGSTYLYGAAFQHDRYWNGTIKRVEDTQIALLQSILDDQVVLRRLFEKERNRAALLGSLKGKLAVSFYASGKSIGSNRVEAWQTRDNRNIRIERADMRVQIKTYEPPSWHHQFMRWLRSPSQWGHPGYDHITAPFVAFFVFSILVGVALLWRSRAAHLERDVLADLNKLGVR